MDYAAKREELITKHNEMAAEADRLIERVKGLRNGAVAVRGQLALIEELEGEEEEEDG
jgi:hypothetical protein